MHEARDWSGSHGTKASLEDGNLSGGSFPPAQEAVHIWLLDEAETGVVYCRKTKGILIAWTKSQIFYIAIGRELRQCWTGKQQVCERVKVIMWKRLLLWNSNFDHFSVWSPKYFLFTFSEHLTWLRGWLPWLCTNSLFFFRKSPSGFCTNERTRTHTRGTWAPNSQSASLLSAKLDVFKLTYLLVGTLLVSLRFLPLACCRGN